MKKLNAVLPLMLILSMLLVSCQAAPTPASDKLGEIMARGTLLISTDPAYPPQSELVENAQRPANTKCTSDQRTSAELRGFDIEVAVEIAKRLGVEPCFTTPDWTLIVAGNWADRWDISVGSIFVQLRALKERLVAGGIPLKDLSMGMSNDFEVAIEEGATYVRVGTAIFGARK